MSKLKQRVAQSLQAMAASSAPAAEIIQRASKTTKTGRMAQKLYDKYFKGMETATKPEVERGEERPTRRTHHWYDLPDLPLTPD